MAKKIEDLYRDHMQTSSPDMDKLWARIEKRIDENDQGEKKQSEPQKPQITVKRSNIGKFIAVAACLAAVVAGTVIFMNSKDNKVETDNSGSYAEAKGVSESEDKNKTAKKQDGTSSAEQKEEKYNRANESADDNESGIEKSSVPTGDDNVSSADPIQPKDRIKSLMKQDNFKSEDIEGKLKLIEELVSEMKASGEIKDYAIKKRQTNSRVEITMPDETIIGLIIN